MFCRLKVTETHEGDFMGVPAISNTHDVESIDIMRVENGKLVEHWGQTDTLELMQQLGTSELV